MKTVEEGLARLGINLNSTSGGGNSSGNDDSGTDREINKDTGASGGSNLPGGGEQAASSENKILSCFRFLDRTREGSISWIEYKVLNDIWYPE